MPNRFRRTGFIARRALIVGVLLAVACFATACNTTSPSLKGTLTISGAAAPAGIVVSAFSNVSQTRVAQAVTDASGQFAFDSSRLPSGDYRIQFGDGSWWQDASSWASATPLTAATNPVPTITAVITAPVNQLSGSVERVSGRPINGAIVQVYTNDNLDSPIAQTTSTTDGTYQLNGLSVMAGFVRFGGDGYTPQTVPLNFDGVTTSQTANVTMQPEGLITGQFAGSSSGYSGMIAEAYDRATGVGVAGSPIDSYGNYSIGALPPGTYTVGLIDANHHYRSSVIGATSASSTSGTAYTVTNGQTTQIGQTYVVGVDCPYQSTNANLTGIDLHDTSLMNCDFSSATLTNANLSGANLSGATMNATTLTNVNFASANLTGASLFASNVSGAQFLGATLVNTVFRSTNLDGTNFGGTAMSGIRSGLITGTPLNLASGWTVTAGYLIGPTANLSGADLSGVDLSGRDLHGASLPATKLIGTSFQGDDLSGANFMSATVSNMNVDGANLASVTFTNVTSGGIVGTPTTMPSGWVLFAGNLFGQWANVTGADVSGADLSGADMSGITSGQLTGTPAALPSGWGFSGGFLIGPAATITGANIAGVDLSNVNLVSVTSGGLVGTPAALPTGWLLYNGYLVGPRANLQNANLSGLSAPGMNLAGTNLQFANLSGANLEGANLSNAHLDVTNLTNTNLANTNLTSAILPRATVTNTTFTGATISGIYSYGMIGTPAALPAGRPIIDGYLLCPGAELTNANLTGVDVSGLDLTGALLLNATLNNMNVSGTNLTGALLSGATGSGMTGTPTALPSDWAIVDGVLTPPNG